MNGEKFSHNEPKSKDNSDKFMPNREHFIESTVLNGLALMRYHFNEGDETPLRVKVLEIDRVFEFDVSQNFKYDTKYQDREFNKRLSQFLMIFETRPKTKVIVYVYKSNYWLEIVTTDYTFVGRGAENRGLTAWFNILFPFKKLGKVLVIAQAV